MAYTRWPADLPRRIGGKIRLVSALREWTAGTSDDVATGCRAPAPAKTRDSLVMARSSATGAPTPRIQFVHDRARLPWSTNVSEGLRLGRDRQLPFRLLGGSAARGTHRKGLRVGVRTRVGHFEGQYSASIEARTDVVDGVRRAPIGLLRGSCGGAQVTRAFSQTLEVRAPARHFHGASSPATRASGSRGSTARLRGSDL